MQVLMAKLAEVERQKREEELVAIRGEQRSVGFGSQIRSYVLQPYQMVKDLRTEHETANVDAVLDGDLDPLHGGLPPLAARRGARLTVLRATRSSRRRTATLGSRRPRLRRRSGRRAEGCRGSEGRRW